jgi:hypothetical protein
LSLIHCWIQIQVLRDYCMHLTTPKLHLQWKITMRNFYIHHAPFSLYTIIEEVYACFVFYIY